MNRFIVFVLLLAAGCMSQNSEELVFDIVAAMAKIEQSCQRHRDGVHPTLRCPWGEPHDSLFSPANNRRHAALETHS